MQETTDRSIQLIVSPVRTENSANFTLWISVLFQIKGTRKLVNYLDSHGRSVSEIIVGWSQIFTHLCAVPEGSFQRSRAAAKHRMGMLELQCHQKSDIEEVL